MSQIHGLKYLVKREGEDGKFGKVLDVLQLVANSPAIPILLERRYHLGPKETWEAFTGLKAGDMDGDGDLDRKDREVINDLNKAA